MLTMGYILYLRENITQHLRDLGILKVLFVLLRLMGGTLKSGFKIRIRRVHLCFQIPLGIVVLWS